MSYLTKVFSTLRRGLVPVSPGGTLKFLRDDGAFVAPGGAPSASGLKLLARATSGSIAAQNGALTPLGNAGAPFNWTALTLVSGSFDPATGFYTVAEAGIWRFWATMTFSQNATGYRGATFEAPGFAAPWNPGERVTIPAAAVLARTTFAMTIETVHEAVIGDTIRPAADCGGFAGALNIDTTRGLMFAAEKIG